jgi:hypothetical protein
MSHLTLLEFRKLLCCSAGVSSSVGMNFFHFDSLSMHELPVLNSSLVAVKHSVEHCCG